MALQPIRSFWTEYNKTLHCLTLLPTVLMLCAVSLLIGTGNEVTHFFSAYRMKYTELTAVMTVITHGANPFFYCVYAHLFYLGFCRQNLKLMLLALGFGISQLLISFLLVRFVKIAVGKPRPMSAIQGEGYSPFSFRPAHHSFPSGHTTEITGSVLPLALRTKQTLTVLLWGGIIAVVAFSRIYLSMHHMADIVGGLLFGSAVGICIQYFCTWNKTR